jgi:hypothetical protein
VALGGAGVERFDYNEGMSENPYRSPLSHPVPSMSEPAKGSVDYIWPAIGFALGTGVVGSLVLSTSVLERGIVGLIFGGVPFGLIGLWYAIRQSKRIEVSADPFNSDKPVSE